jgi:hypothetical protein
LYAETGMAAKEEHGAEKGMKGGSRPANVSRRCFSAAGEDQNNEAGWSQAEQASAGHTDGSKPTA